MQDLTRLSATKLGVHIPDLHRRKASVWKGGTQDITGEGRVVAPQQRYRRRNKSSRSGHYPRSQQSSSTGLGESRAGARSMEERRLAGQLRHQNQ